MKIMRKSIRKAVIPAAGWGTRFLPATKASPKEMLPLVDKPLIQYVVEEAVASGITDIIVITSRGKRSIEDHFDTSFELEANLKASGKHSILKEIQRISDLARFTFIRQKEMRGLGHAILCAEHLVGNEPFAVLLGDDIMVSQVPAIAQMVRLYDQLKSSIISIQAVPKSEIQNYGVLKAKQIRRDLYRVVDLIEKPLPEKAPSDLGIIGRYILTPDIFSALKRTRPGKNDEIQLTDALRIQAKKKSVYGFKLKGKRYDAGDKLGFLKATVELGLKDPELGQAFSKYLRALKV